MARRRLPIAIALSWVSLAAVGASSAHAVGDVVINSASSGVDSWANVNCFDNQNGGVDNDLAFDNTLPLSAVAGASVQVTCPNQGNPYVASTFADATANGDVTVSGSGTTITASGTTTGGGSHIWSGSSLSEFNLSFSVVNGPVHWDLTESGGQLQFDPAVGGQTSGTLQPGSYSIRDWSNCSLSSFSTSCTGPHPNGYSLTLQLGPGGDSDGDGLFDLWEDVGVDIDDDGQVDLDLPAMGADPDHKDIFVEVDEMAGHHIPQAQINAVVQAFDDAPVANPDGQTGIALHVDNGSGSIMKPGTSQTWGSRSDQDTITHQNVLGTNGPGGPSEYDMAEFDLIRDAAFEAERGPAFHYAIATHSGPDQSFAGIARAAPSSDFMIAMHENCSPSGIPVTQECSPDPEYLAATFMHELGHNLGLNHGGTDELPDKPNYLSIMNTAFGFGLVLSDGTHKLDYSRFDIPLNENALDEQHGFGISDPAIFDFSTMFTCPGTTLKPVITLQDQTVDWNCDGTHAPGTVAADVTGDSVVSQLPGAIDWDNLVYDGGAVGGLNKPPGPTIGTIDEPTPAELIANRKLLDDAAVHSGPKKPPPAEAKCSGQGATITGSAAAEKLTGTPGPDVIASLGGNDTVRGLGGNDLICGGAGDDSLVGGAGRDRLFGDAGKDRLNGGGGKGDACNGGAGKDRRRSRGCERRRKLP